MSETGETLLTCYNHPDRETMLRCNRCERPICTACAVLTPTGYRCKECVRGQQKTFDTSTWYDYPVAFVIGAVLSFIGSVIVSRMGFFFIFFLLFLGPLAGVVIAEAIRWAVRRRRSKLLFRIATLGVVLGALVLPLLAVAEMILVGRGAGLFGLLWPIIYLVMVTSAVYYRLSGIRIR